MFAYYIVASVAEGMGENGTIPAIVSAWGPGVLLFVAAGWAARAVVRRGAVDILGALYRIAGRLPVPDWIFPKTA